MTRKETERAIAQRFANAYRWTRWTDGVNEHWLAVAREAMRMMERVWQKEHAMECVHRNSGNECPHTPDLSPALEDERP